jgi:cathepsin B
MLALLPLLSQSSSSAGEWGDIISAVNGANATWVAGPVDRSAEDFAAMCGTFLPGHPQYQAPANLPEYAVAPGAAALFDDAIDWRAKAPQCASLATVRDQSACGSCWAFASTEVFGDRRCIATGKDVEFSAQDTAGCCTGFSCGMSHGCKGGQPSAALGWLAKNGVVTGGDYGDIGGGKSCQPYLLAPCAHHTTGSKYQPCGAPLEIHCNATCSEPGYAVAYADDKVSGGTSAICAHAEQMLAALQHGPISAGFSVYDDFPTYKSGVYAKTKGAKELGGHAVEIIGYGTDAAAGDYWLVKNSWNEEWGDEGFFKIKRGSNECGIEQNAASIDF